MLSRANSLGGCLLAFVVFVSLPACLPGIGQEAGPTGSQPAGQDSERDPIARRLRLIILEGMDQFPCKQGATEAPGERLKQALDAFGRIQQDTETFAAITHHLSLEAAQLGDDEKLLVYCDYRRLQTIHLEPSGDKYRVIFGGAKQSPAGVSAVSLIDRNGNFQTMIVSSSVSPLQGPNPAAPRSTISKLDFPDVRYRIARYFGTVHVCGPRLVVVGHERQEAATFPEIQKDAATFRLIAQHLGLQDLSHPSDQQKVLVYREYKRLRVIVLDHLVHKFRFQLLVVDRAKAVKGTELFQIVGLIDPQDQVSIARRQPIFTDPCPR